MTLSIIKWIEHVEMGKTANFGTIDLCEIACFNIILMSFSSEKKKNFNMLIHTEKRQDDIEMLCDFPNFYF